MFDLWVRFLTQGDYSGMKMFAQCQELLKTVSHCFVSNCLVYIDFTVLCIRRATDFDEAPCLSVRHVLLTM